MRRRIPTILCLSALSCLVSGSVGAGDTIDCKNPHAPIEQMICNGRELERLDKELNRIWEKALAATPKDGSTADNRKERQQLMKSQKAWNRFREEDCAFSGGLEGGTNQWVTIFAQMCEQEMYKDRIRFLKQIADEK